MAQLDNKIKWCLGKGKEGKKHRGLKKVKPDLIKAERHIYKANHNFWAMKYLMKSKYSDWAVSAAFYSMYHCLMAIIAKHGYESRNQECTFAAVEHLIKAKKIDLDIKWIRKITDIDDNSETVIVLREEFQYGFGTEVDSRKLKNLSDDCKEFIDITRDILKQ